MRRVWFITISRIVAPAPPTLWPPAWNNVHWTSAHWELALGAESARTRHLVLATGAWPSRHLVGKASLRTKKIVAFHLTDCPPPRAGTPILYFAQDQSFLLPRPSHRDWLLSITSIEWDLPAGEGCTATDVEHALARRILATHVPSLAGAVLQPVVAVDSYTDAFEPQIVPCAASTQGCAALGSSGSGVRLGAGLGGGGARCRQLLTASIRTWPGSVPEPRRSRPSTVHVAA